MKQERVLITGGSGFLGQYIIKELINHGFQVTVFDTNDFDNVELKNKILFIQGDIRDKDRLNKSIINHEYVIHIAAILPISRSSKKIFWDINVQGTENVLHASLANYAKKVIFISSSAPYGIPLETPITESTPFNPVCDYGRSKIAAEDKCKEYQKKGLNVIVLRPRTIIGKGRLGLFQILFSWISENRNIYIIGKGNNLFQYVSPYDLARACILAIKNNCKNEYFNLGSDSFDTVRKEIEVIIQHANSSSKIIPIPAFIARFFLSILNFLNLSPLTTWHYKTPDKPFYFDTSKAKRILGWQPRDDNNKILISCYDWYINNKNKIDSNYGTTHKNAVRQRILKILKKLS